MLTIPLEMPSLLRQTWIPRVIRWALILKFMPKINNPIRKCHLLLVTASTNKSETVRVRKCVITYYALMPLRQTILTYLGRCLWSFTRGRILSLVCQVKAVYT